MYTIFDEKKEKGNTILLQIIIKILIFPIIFKF